MPPEASSPASRVAEIPPTAFKASRGTTPPSTSFAAAPMSSSSTTTASAPRARSSSAAAARRTTLSVFQPRWCAISITARPTAEVAAFCSTQSPGWSAANWCKRSQAVGGLTRSTAAWSAASPSGTATTRSSGQLPDSRQAWPSTRTFRPTHAPSTPAPTATTRPQPSLPGTSGKSLASPYLPSIILRSAGLIGAQNMPTVTSCFRGGATVT